MKYAGYFVLLVFIFSIFGVILALLNYDFIKEKQAVFFLQKNNNNIINIEMKDNNDNKDIYQKIKEREEILKKTSEQRIKNIEEEIKKMLEEEKRKEEKRRGEKEKKN